MKERQTLGEKKEKLKTCSVCGITLPRHSLDCTSIPGGEVLYASNLEDQRQWEKEKGVPREQGIRILRAILAMLTSPNHEVMVQRKRAIFDEIEAAAGGRKEER